MDTWIDIRRKARACNEQALLKTKGDRQANAVIAAALCNDNLELRRLDFPPGTLGSLDRSARLVNIANGQASLDENVVIAHEIGHFQLHIDPHNEVKTRTQGLGGDPIESGAGKVEGYSPRERKEVQADVFAGELLCPSNWLREEFVVRRKRPHEIAADLGLPTNLVMNQMVRALLLPPLRPLAPEPPGVDHELDESQKIAVTWNKGPLLVDAGPGTGKTRTLIRRIKHLVDQGSQSGEFLALTFSNKAAEEMRERLSAMNSDAAIEMWVGTFHAFGLELVTKWPSSVGRTSKVKVLDQTGSLALLEANLEKLPLRHYQNLYEPAYELVLILRAISRCKDELISPAQYADAANTAYAAAQTDEERKSAEKTQEIAAVYKIYEQALQETDAVDFGDLVRLAAHLVEKNQEVQSYIAGFKHVLVDEFQDVNFASAALLRSICGTRVDVWVVADQRQSIYRFRGAEPSNVSRFNEVFGGSRHALENNYRSFVPIVRLFEMFSVSMLGGTTSSTWKVHRKGLGEATLTTSPTLAAEAEAIRDKIEFYRTKGLAFHDQVILARSHLTLVRITNILEQLGVPLLYLGDLFERSEIRDLLSILALDAEFGGVGLPRVAALPEYQVPRADSLALVDWAIANEIRMFDALNRVDEVQQLSIEGRLGLVKLGSHLHGLANASPWILLTTWLFERSDYLRPMLDGNHVISQQRLVAIYQFLKVCGEYAATGESSRRRFLERIRRIEALNEDTAYRAVSSEAADMDAVRVMTIHGSKGLEFRAVHLPALATGYMPSSWRGVRAPPPPSLARLAMQSTGHDDEEACIFFVALSRAKDYISLSRAEKYTMRNASSSKFLASIAEVAPAQRYQGTGKGYTNEILLQPPSMAESYPERDLELYMQCPARYRYQVIESLRGGRDESAYVRFHRCVYVTVGWLEAQRQKGNVVNTEDAATHLAAIWTQHGPVGYGFENYYRRAADAMVKIMAETIVMETGQYDRRDWFVSIGHRKISITPDRVQIGISGNVRVQRIRTGRKTKSEPDKPIYALLRRGAGMQYPGREISVETFYLGSGEQLVVAAKNDEKLLALYTDAMDNIEKGDFHADPDARRCPNCPYYLTCGD